MAGADPYLGEITMFAGNFAPRGYALCQGQLLPIAQNSALFSLLGTTYGGDGRTTFALPDLRGRTPLQAGQGPGLSDVKLGEKGGNEVATLRLGTNTTYPGVAADRSTQPVSFVQAARELSVRSPYLGVNYIICLQGVFPSRS